MDPTLNDYERNPKNVVLQSFHIFNGRKQEIADMRHLGEDSQIFALYIIEENIFALYIIGELCEAYSPSLLF